MLKSKFKLSIGFIIIFLISIFLLINYNKNQGYIVFGNNIAKPINISVLLYKVDDPYIFNVQKSLIKIENENKENVKYTFYDSKGKESLQQENLDQVLKQGSDLIMLNLVNINNAQEIIDKIKVTNIPLIIFNREPNVPENPIKSYSKAIFIGTDAKEAGILQGKIITSKWQENKGNVDKNSNNTLEYVMLMGEKDNIEAIDRTKYSILSIQEAGINVNELALRVANWNKETAKESMKLLLYRYGNSIEAILANNDAMAIGAIEALQSVGYNEGDKDRTILVVGVDGIDKAKELIDKGYMTGTVIQDDYAMAEVLYNVGNNLVLGKYPLEGTDYKFDDTGVSIRIPYGEYKNKD